VKHKIIIAQHRPWRRWIITGSITAMVLLGGWGVYIYTRPAGARPPAQRQP
jgi:hypothetical protein